MTEMSGYMTPEAHLSYQAAFVIDLPLDPRETRRFGNRSLQIAVVNAGRNARLYTKIKNYLRLFDSTH